jgi:acyl-coenzyme A synthetase/AMP-(fatty) acid ligase
MNLKDENFNESIINLIQKSIKEIIGNDSKLNIYFVESVPKTPTGKYRFTISKINLDEILKTL